MICRVCNAEKPAADFYPRQGRECKACTRARVRQHRRQNDSVREYDRKRAKEPRRRAKSVQTAREWRETNPAAYKAQNAVNNAIRDGKLKREPCAFCASTTFVHAHHRDYSKPLAVVWVCAKCHHRLHALFPELEGANKREAG